MLIYASYGVRNFRDDPVVSRRRGRWEFWVLLEGSVIPALSTGRGEQKVNATVLWAFPPDFEFGWSGTESCERAVFDFSVVPTDLERNLPARGYYRVALSERERDRAREIAGDAMSTFFSPTQFARLRQQTIAQELSLLALAEAPHRALPRKEMAITKTEQALACIEGCLRDNAEINLAQVAERVHISPAHLRRLFHEARGESPRAAVNRLRMDKAVHLLRNLDATLETVAEEVGLSSASVLIRTMKRNFGKTPSELRQWDRDARAESRKVSDPDSVHEKRG